jgi:exonuclease III
MIILSWNLRGLNSGPIQKVVRDLVRTHSLDFLFLQETKLSVESMTSLSSKLWSRGDCQCIGAHGTAGGVACLWNPLRIHPLRWMSSKSSMSLIATSIETGETILLSNIYAPIDFLGK